jgi:hypothetical protein
MPADLLLLGRRQPGMIPPMALRLIYMMIPQRRIVPGMTRRCPGSLVGSRRIRAAKTAQ